MQQGGERSGKDGTRCGPSSGQAPAPKRQRRMSAVNGLSSAHSRRDDWIALDEKSTPSCDNGPPRTMVAGSSVLHKLSSLCPSVPRPAVRLPRLGGYAAKAE